MKPRIFIIAVALYIGFQLHAADLPTGQKTSEGVACDAVMAYARSDSKLWLSILVRPIYGKEGDTKYEEFKKEMVATIDKNKQKKEFVPPKILKCFKAREFSRNGSGSLAYAMHQFSGNMFVDILVEVTPGKTQNIRYHVLRDKDDKWYFEPRPDLASLLAVGLNHESESTKVLYERK